MKTASLLFLSLLSAASANVAGETGASCREETRRVAVWQPGGNPKIQQIPRFENRTVTVCDTKHQAKDPAHAQSTR